MLPRYLSLFQSIFLFITTADKTAVSQRQSDPHLTTMWPSTDNQQQQQGAQNDGRETDPQLTKAIFHFIQKMPATRIDLRWLGICENVDGVVVVLWVCGVEEVNR